MAYDWQGFIGGWLVGMESANLHSVVFVFALVAALAPVPVPAPISVIAILALTNKLLRLLRSPAKLC